MKKITYFVLTAIIFAGCYYDIDVYRDPDFKPHLSVFTYIGEGSPFNVFVSKSDYPGEVDTNDILTGAQVEIITQSGQTLLPDSARNGYYFFGPLSEDNFKISVKALDMETTAEVSFPPVVDNPGINANLYNLSFIPDMNNVYFLDYSLKLNIKIQDNAEYENVYGLYFYTREAIFYYDTVNYVQTDSITGYSEESVYVYSDDFSENSYYYLNIPNYPADRVMAFSDGIFNGNTLTINLDVGTNKLVSGQPATDTIYCVYFSLSPEMFKYARSLERYYQTHDNPFAEPVDIYSNFSQGIGLAAVYRVIDTIPVVVNLQ